MGRRRSAGKLDVGGMGHWRLRWLRISPIFSHRGPHRSPWPGAYSSDGSGVGEIFVDDDFGGDENQQLFFADAFGIVFKQISNERQITKKRYLVF